MDKRERIARRVAQELQDGDVVNLGIGLPTQVAAYLPAGVEVILQSENGFLGMGEPVSGEARDIDIVDAGGQHVSLKPIGSFFDSALSFGIIRGGHVDVTVLGALEVDQFGNLANWIIPGKLVPGMGGAMDLARGAKKVIVATEHCTKKGTSKIRERCQLPLTVEKGVHLVVTELAVLEVTQEGLVVKEMSPGVTPQELREKTEAPLIFPAGYGNEEGKRDQSVS